MSLAGIAKSLEESLSLKLPPIAVATAASVPDGVPLYRGQAPAGCFFWQEAARGAFATTTADHELCSIGVHTHHLAEPSATHPAELGEVLRVMAGLDYVRPEDVPGIPVISREVNCVVYAPLSSAPLPPDVVLLFAHARQGLVLTEAIQQVDGGVPPAMGRPACAVIPQAMNSGRAAQSLGCCGARAYLDAFTDDIALWALPGATIGRYAERIAVLARANALLGKFHELRRLDVERGGRPTVHDSLARLQSAG